MKIAGLTKENIDYVIDHIAPSCFQEVKAFSKTPAMLKEEFYSMTGKPFTASFTTDADRPCAIFFMRSVGVNHWRTHFVYTRTAFKSVGRELTKFFREFADVIILDTGGKIEIRTVFPDSQFFEDIGFSIGGKNKCVVTQAQK